MGRLKSFKEYSKYPLASIGDCEIPRIILGTHPFDGTTYTSVERDLQFRKQWVEAAGIAVDGYSTPVNAAGILMFPTQSLALHAIHATTKPVIAIKPLGGGRVPPQHAFPYVFREVGVTAAMVGIGTVAEAQETLQAAQQVLRPERTH